MMRERPYRVLIWGSGKIGRACLREVIRNPGLELAGVLTYSDEKDGTDAGALVGLSPIGVTVTRDQEALLGSEAEVVLHATQMTGDLAETDATVRKILEAGKNVISSTSYHYPFRHGRAYVERLYRACQSGGSTLMGTGVHPGFLGEVLGMTLSGLCHEIERVTLREYIDVSHGEDLQGLKFLGFGAEPDALAGTDNPFFEILERYWGDSLAFLARALFDAEATIERRTSFVPARERVERPGLVVEPGQVGMLQHELKAIVEGTPRLFVEESLYLSNACKPRDYIQSADFYEIDIEGRPSSLQMRMALKASLAADSDFWPGDPTGQAWFATATPMVQAIPAIVAAEPGLMLPDTLRHHVGDARRKAPMRDLVTRELERLGIAA